MPPERARALHREPVMPRKQRFKPTRKPKPAVEAPTEVHPDDVEQGETRQAPARDPSAPPSHDRDEHRSR